MLSKRYKSTEVERTIVELGYMCPRGNSGPAAVTLTKWLKWCVHARYLKVLSVIVSMFKRRMEKKLGERREKWGAMHRLVVSFWDCFTVTLSGLMLLYYMRGGGRFWWSFPSRIWAELWYSGPTWTKKLCLQDNSLSWLLGTGMVLKL